MAHIRQYANGRWQAVVRRRGYPPRSEGFASKTEAVQWARAVEAQVDNRTYADRSVAERTTMAAAIDRYLEEVTPGKRSARSETQRLNHLKRIFGKHTLVTLQREEIAKYRDQRLRDGKASGTVIKELNSLCHVFEVARKDWGYPLPENPVKLVRKPKAGRGRDRRLQPGEYERLKQASAESKCLLLPFIIDLAIETAMRLGELLSLKWGDIDFSQRYAMLDLTKNGERRAAPLSTRAVATLGAIPRHISNPRVFWCWSRPDAFENAWRRAVKKANIADLRFHDLRHESASRLFERGLNPMEVAAITGHKTLQVLKRYVHFKPQDLAAKLG